jgi:hypothetical protein
METHPGAIVALTIAIYIYPAGAKEARSRAVQTATKATKALDCASEPSWKASLVHDFSQRSRGNRIKSKNLDLKDRFLQTLHILFSHPFSVVDPDQGSGAFLTLGSGIRNSFFRIPDP